MSDVMWSIAQIAVRDAVSKAAVSKTVKKLLDARPETPVERGGQGQVLRISLAHYDEFRQRFVNPAKATAPIRAGDDDQVSGRSTGGRPLRDEDSFDEARRQSEWLKVGREKIRHQEECGQLIRRDRTEDAIKEIGAKLLAIIRRLPNQADAVALAVSKEGVHGVRVLLRQIAFEIGNQMADELEAIAAAAPESDPLIEDEEA
ncbi:hypothetical protein NBH20_01490 [Rhizobium sp. S153]|uniref:Terminase small subunit n=1 Tax=Ciceribacter sichuanensis TaxID=2949647 RepID=A0ABT0V1Q0_9HYPH|nr:hypothetical protein [Ciceribacter sp. S153]MCM2399815.1 hypothetical protein [Ciceribacter sp. S153]